MMKRLAALLAVASIGTACSISDQTPEQRQRARKVAEDYDKQRKADMAEEKQKADAAYAERISSPGSISEEESDALIAKLAAPNPVTRRDAAQDLGRAKGYRAAPAMIAALKAETDEEAFIGIVQGLENLHDFRALEPLVEAMAAPGMSDQAHNAAFDAIRRWSSATRFLPQVRAFAKTVTDEQVQRNVTEFLRVYDR